MDHSPRHLASTSKAKTWFDEVVTTSTLQEPGGNPPAVTDASFNRDINQCCLFPNNQFVTYIDFPRIFITNEATLLTNNTTFHFRLTKD